MTDNNDIIESDKTEQISSANDTDVVESSEAEELDHFDEVEDDDSNQDFDSLDDEQYELSKDPYFEDDELFIGDDNVIDSDNESSIIQQLDNVISFKVKNFYKDDYKSVRNQYSLRTDPPIFELTDSKGNVIDLTITKEMSAILEKTFGDIRKAYYGVNPVSSSNVFSKKGFKEKVDSSVAWVSENRIPVIIVGILLLVLIVVPPLLNLR